MARIEKHITEIKKLARRHDRPIAAGISKSKHGPYLRVETNISSQEDLHKALRFAKTLHEYAKENKIHAALDIRIPGGDGEFVLHIPFNYKKGPYKLPKIGRKTLHHGSRAEQPGKIAIALPIADGRHIFDDVGIIKVGKNGDAKVLTDFDVLGIHHGANKIELHIGEVLTDHYDRIDNKVRVWREFIDHLEKMGIKLKLAAPIILLVGDPLTLEENKGKIREAMVRSGFKNHGLITATYTAYKQWKDVVNAAARMPLEDHRELLRPAQRALVSGNLNELARWSMLFETLSKNRKHINKGIKAGKWPQIKIEVLRFPEHFERASKEVNKKKLPVDPVTLAIHRVIWGIVQHLPPNAANGLKKRFGTRPL